jgi:hypothetical protein
MMKPTKFLVHNVFESFCICVCLLKQILNFYKWSKFIKIMNPTRYEDFVTLQQQTK